MRMYFCCIWLKKTSYMLRHYKKDKQKPNMYNSLHGAFKKEMI